MNVLRRISLPAHSLLELVLGLALLTSSLALGLAPAGMVALLAAGALLTGIGLGAAETLPLAAHRALDQWMAIAMSASSVGLALAGDATGAVVLLAVAAGQLVLGSATRWTRAPVATS